MPDHGHGNRPAVAGSTDHPVRRYPCAVEGHLTELVGDPIDHAQRALLHTRLFHLEHERRQAAVALSFGVGARQQQTPVSDIGVAGPDLMSVHHIGIALKAGGGGQRGQIRTGAGLAETLAPSLGAVDDAGQEALPQFVARVPADAVDQIAHTGTRRSGRPGQFFIDDDVVDRWKLLAAVFTGKRQPEEALLVEGLMPLGLAGPVLVTRTGKFLGVQRKPGSQPFPEGGFGW